jgi:hypothetical protein
MVSAACHGEICWCGAPAVKKVGEEILFDDPMPARHNLTCYICGPHYAQLMGPLGAKQVGMEAVRPPVGEEIWRVRCEHLLACIDSCNEAGSPPDEMDHEDIALIDETRTALAMQSNG